MAHGKRRGPHTKCCQMFTFGTRGEKRESAKLFVCCRPRRCISAADKEGVPLETWEVREKGDKAKDVFIKEASARSNDVGT